MLNRRDALLQMVNPRYMFHVTRLRSYLQDTAELNTLMEEQECTDFDLYMALQDTMEQINYEYIPETTWAIDTVPSWNALKFGAILQILTMKGILSARNTLTFNDAGGIQVSDLDKYGRYINYFNVLLNNFHRSVSLIKLQLNIDGCYGGVHSEYIDVAT